MTGAGRAARSRGAPVPLLGLCTAAAAVTGGVLLETDEGPDLVGHDSSIAGGLSIALLAATVAAFMRMARRGRVPGPAVAGFTVALCAHPLTVTLMTVTLIVLNGLGIRW